MFHSQTYGKLNIEQIPDKLLLFYETHKDFGTPIHIIIGSDSQNFSDTKVVNVITIVCEGHGGIFFYQISYQPKIMDVRKKLHEETQESLEIAETIVSILENNERYEELFLCCSISIHIDAGNSTIGKTKDLIPELIGWVNALGFDVKIKPESFASSTIADRISKPKDRIRIHKQTKVA